MFSHLTNAVVEKGNDKTKTLRRWVYGLMIEVISYTELFIVQMTPSVLTRKLNPPFVGPTPPLSYSGTGMFVIY